MNAVIQRKTGKLLGWCRVPGFGQGCVVPIRWPTGRITVISFRYRYPQSMVLQWTDDIKLKDIHPQIIAYGYRDAGLLPRFKRYNL